MSETSNNDGSSENGVESSGVDCRKDRVFFSCEDYKALNQFLNKIGKKILDVPGDGNCLFHACMAAVNEMKKTGEIVVGDNFPENYTMMRKLLVEHLMRIKEEFLSEEKKESWKYGLKPLNKDIVSGRLSVFRTNHGRNVWQGHWTRRSGSSMR